MKLTIASVEYFVDDALSGLTVADSFVSTQNKTGSGHGEAKLYVGRESEENINFFNSFKKPFKCFILKKDLFLYMREMKFEYLHPSQGYMGKENFTARYQKHYEMIGSLEDLLCFEMDRVEVGHSGIYINITKNGDKNSKKYWKLLRDISLPNKTALSIMKLKAGNDTRFYFKLETSASLNDAVEEYQFEKMKKEILDRNDISETEKASIIMARRGQGIFRDNLLRECVICPFTYVDDSKLLIASHIKPWSESDNTERLDYKNGFIFTPTYDRLFDRGYITFTENKKLIISPWLSVSNRDRLGLEDGMSVDLLPDIDEKRKQYLLYHKTNIYRA